MHELSDTQMRALTALLSGKNVPESAQAAGVDPSTVRRWVREDTNFNEALAAGRREALWRAMNVMADAVYVAVETVVKVMKNSRANPHVRLAAARVILETMTKWLELQDFDQRLRRLEGRDATE